MPKVAARNRQLLLTGVSYTPPAASAANASGLLLTALSEARRRKSVQQRGLGRGFDKARALSWSGCDRFSQAVLIRTECPVVTRPRHAVKLFASC
jgi:hypothetical protein